MPVRAACRVERSLWIVVGLITLLVVGLGVSIVAMQWWGERRVDECLRTTQGIDDQARCGSADSWFG